LIDLGEFDAAIDDGTRLVELRPEHPGGYALRAWARFETGDAEGAQEDIVAATRPLPEDTQAWDAFFIRCLALKAVGRLDEAEQDCLRVLDLNPGHVISLDALGLIAFERGETAVDDDEKLAHYQNGIDYMRQVIEIDPDNAAAYKNVGAAEIPLRQFSDADRDLSRAVELNPEYAHALLDRAQVRVFLGRPQEALDDVNRGVESYFAKPDDRLASQLDPREVLATRVFVATYVEDYDTAIGDVTTLDEQGGSSPWLLTMRALALLESGGDRGRAIADLDQAIGMNQDLAQGYDRRGYAYYLAGDYERAQADLDEALTLVTLLDLQERSELFYHRALLFQAQGRITAAQAEIDEATNLVEVPGVRERIEALRSELYASAESN
jgi:tetratricopeptide (TPR) repeat protein